MFTSSQVLRNDLSMNTVEAMHPTLFILIGPFCGIFL